MATLDEVSTGQEAGIIMLKERKGATLACMSKQAQNAHFLPPSTNFTQLLKLTMETSEEVSTRQEVE